MEKYKELQSYFEENLSDLFPDNYVKISIHEKFGGTLFISFSKEKEENWPNSYRINATNLDIVVDMVGGSFDVTMNMNHKMKQTGIKKMPSFKGDIERTKNTILRWFTKNKEILSKKEVSENKEETTDMVLLDGHRGIYIPRDFAKMVRDGNIKLINKDELELELEDIEDPSKEEYWDSWDTILSSAKVSIGGKNYTLMQDSDLFLVSELSESTDPKSTKDIKDIKKGSMVFVSGLWQFVEDVDDNTVLLVDGNNKKSRITKEFIKRTPILIKESGSKTYTCTISDSWMRSLESSYLSIKTPEGTTFTIYKKEDGWSSNPEITELVWRVHKTASEGNETIDLTRDEIMLWKSVSRTSGV